MLKKKIVNDERIVLLGGGFISLEFSKLLKKKKQESNKH